SERIRSKGCVVASSSALAALSQTVASWPSRRKARESEASVLASSSTMSRCAFCDTLFSSILPRVSRCGSDCGRRVARQLNPKRGSLFLSAFDRYFPTVVAYHRLRDRQSKPGAVLLGRVIRSEQPRAFFRRQAGTSVGNRNGDASSGFARAGDGRAQR